MADRSEELLLTWLSQRVESLTRLSSRHPLVTDGSLALCTAAASVVVLATQNRVTPGMLGFCAALCLPLLLRHRSVRLAYAAVAAVALVQWLTSGPQLADLAVLIALYSVCLESDLRSIVAAVAVAEAGAIMLALGWEAEKFRYWVGVSGLAVAAAAVGLMIRQRRELLLSLQERASRLERERDRQAELGAAAERARIAREMHDIVSHNLTVMIALADGALYAVDSSPGRAADAIRRVSATGRQALVEMRRLLGVLREEAEPEPLEPQPTLDRLDDLVARVVAAGIPVTIDLDGDFKSLAPGVQLAVFRVAQEALTNTLKHASRPTAAHLALSCRGGQVDLEISNTGPSGADLRHPVLAAAAADGRGLLGMRERANAYDGQLQAGPTEDGGWRVRLQLQAEASGPSAQATLEAIT